MNRSVLLLAAALKAYDRTHALERCDRCGAQWDGQEGTGCAWCHRRRKADHDHILKPPSPRGYGYATADDLTKLGIDPAADRNRDLEHWRHDLQLAADTGLITEQEGETAWQSATSKNPTFPQNSSTSSTGTTSTTTSTKTTPSSTTSPSAVVGPPSPRERKRANRRSSSGWWWKPPGAE